MTKQLQHAKTAIIHDFLYTYAGAERVLEEILALFPQADLFALFDFLPEKDRHFLRGRKVRTTFLQKLPFASKKHRAFLPLMPLAIESLDLSAYDLVISCSYLAAKGVLTAPHQLHVCYCHSPARFAWDQQQQYLAQSNLTRGPKGFLARTLLHYIRNWDLASAARPDAFLANSDFIRQRIEKTYRRDATVVYPPVDTAKFSPPRVERPRDNFYVTASRLVPYKRLDVIIQAFAASPRRLTVIGDGPEMPKLQALADCHPNIQLLGQQPHSVLLDHLQRARGFVFAAEEDFGIAPVEAQACGTPVIAFGRGGSAETVLPGDTGILFEEQTPVSLFAALNDFEARHWNADRIRQNAERFSKSAFQQNLMREITAAWAHFRSDRTPLRLAPGISERPLLTLTAPDIEEAA